MKCRKRDSCPAPGPGSGLDSLDIGQFVVALCEGQATLGFFLAMESRSISLAYLSNDMRQFSTKFGMSNIFAETQPRKTEADCRLAGGLRKFKLKH